MKIDIKHIKEKLVKKNRYLFVLILLSFSLTFGIIRIVTHLQKAGIIPNQTGENHFHHMIIGIIGLLVVGFIAIVFDNVNKRSWIAVVYGIAAALTIDEFALWLFLKDVYWLEEGRLSIEAAVFAICIVLIVILINESIHLSLWQKFKKVLVKLSF